MTKKYKPMGKPAWVEPTPSKEPSIDSILLEAMICDDGFEALTEAKAQAKSALLAHALSLLEGRLMFGALPDEYVKGYNACYDLMEQSLREAYE